MRGISNFQEQQYGDFKITTMVSDEAGIGSLLLVSIVGKGLPRIRITTNGVETMPEDMLGLSEEQGIILYGHDKTDRPVLA